MKYINVREDSFVKIINLLERLDEKISAVEYALLDVEELSEKEITRVDNIRQRMEGGQYYSLKELKRRWNV